MSREILGRQWDRSPEGVALRNDLGVKREGPKTARHPKSGYRVPVGRETRDVQGSSPPMAEVVDHGHFPNRNNAGMGPTVIGQRPIRHVYRGVSEVDYQRIKAGGRVDSDGRGNVCSDEGTCATTDPRGAAVYGGDVKNYRVLKIKVHPDDGWTIDPRDGYAKTNAPIPSDRVVRATRALQSDRGRASK